MKSYWAVAIGGALGCTLRFCLMRLVEVMGVLRHFPLAVLLANVIGCLLAGLLAGFLWQRYALSPVWRAGILVGFLGGLTTFSSFSLDSVRLLFNGQAGVAMINIAANVVLCLLATGSGLLLSKQW